MGKSWDMSVCGEEDKLECGNLDDVFFGKKAHARKVQIWADLSDKYTVVGYLRCCEKDSEAAWLLSPLPRVFTTTQFWLAGHQG